MMPREQLLFRAAAILIAGASLACQEPPAVATITVDFPGTTATNPALLLYSGMEGSACQVYQPNVANPAVTLPFVSWDPPCDVEVEAFAPGLGTFANSIDPTIPGSEGWLIDAIETGTLSITLPDLTPVPLQIWLVAGGPADVATAEALRNRLLDKAYPILETFGTGLTLDTVSAVRDTSLVPKRCTDANAISTNPAIYDASRINVYFLPFYGGVQVQSGQNCFLQGHPEIVFIAWGMSNVTDPTLVHELGHALGLVHPNTLGGHTYLVPGFDPFNLMATNSDVTNVTVGQLYSLNYSTDTWLNRTGSPLKRPVVKGCQDSWSAGLCPALTLVVPGWPP